MSARRRRKVQACNPGPAPSVNALSCAARERWRGEFTLPGNREALSPRIPQARHDLGVTFLRLGMLAEAAGSLRSAIELRPSFSKRASALVNLAYVQKRPEGAWAGGGGAIRNQSKTSP